MSLRRLGARLATEPPHRKLFATLSAVEAAFIEQTAAKRRSLRANLEFYKGVVCLSLGIPKEFFTSTFAASRMFGWVGVCQ